MQARNADFSNSFLIFFEIRQHDGLLAKQNAEKNELLRIWRSTRYDQVIEEYVAKKSECRRLEVWLVLRIREL